MLSYTQGRASSMPSSYTARQCVLKHCSRQHTRTLDGPDLLVWGCIALLCFALNGEPSSAWQFLPPDIWQIFFCGSEASLPDATCGGAPLGVIAGGAHPSLLHSLPRLSAVSPPKETQSTALCFALPSTALVQHEGLQSGHSPDQAGSSPAAGM